MAMVYPMATSIKWICNKFEYTMQRDIYGYIYHSVSFDVIWFHHSLPPTTPNDSHMLLESGGKSNYVHEHMHSLVC